ncbi:hypothetical protein F0562_030566 [Nyssa sinensis]|uniref:Uncharacterized protein n=1 Tax=Nyssa sinensis TaxID=561372 RepID=A0A5J5AZ46_9ASTE|nr:hypothetical protein F0562_030566 [Nyssa sinensis]
MYALRSHFSLLFDSQSSAGDYQIIRFRSPSHRHSLSLLTKVLHQIPAESLAFAHKPLESKSSAGHFNCSQAIHSQPMKTLNEIPTIAV